MNVIQSLDSVGQYATLLRRTLTLPDRFREFFKEFFKEMYKLGVNSLWIVVIISFFIGAVMVVQIAYTVGVFINHHVFDFSWEGRFKHCFRNWNNACD